jgi:hypothetical protein
LHHAPEGRAAPSGEAALHQAAEGCVHVSRRERILLIFVPRSTRFLSELKPHFIPAVLTQREIFCTAIYFSPRAEPLNGMSDELSVHAPHWRMQLVHGPHSPQDGPCEIRRQRSSGGEHMQLAKWIARAAGVTALVLGGTVAAHAQTVTFTDIRDAVPGRFFDAATTAPDYHDGNTLRIGLHSGLDFRTFKYADFRASSASFSHPNAMDTISFRVVAPDGYYISKITYRQRGTGSVVRTGRAAGMTNWVVGKISGDLGSFATNPTLADTIDLTGLNLTDVPVSISNSLFAFSTPLLGSATVGVTGAEVLVELSPLATEGGSD